MYKKNIIAFLCALSIVSSTMAVNGEFAVKTFAENANSSESSDDLNESSNQDSSQEEIHEHAYSRTVIVEPGCETKGQALYKCECGDEYTEDIDALGHVESDWIVDKEADYGVKGERHKECSRCGKILATEEINSLTYNLSDCVISYTSKIKYTGSQIKPALIVKNGETLLIKDTDYKVTYSNNLDVGTAQIKITGIGKYAGEVNKGFEIVAPTVNAPKNFKNKHSTETATRLIWDKVADVSGYELENWNSSTKKWVKLETFSANIDTYAQRKMPVGKSTKYRLRSYKTIKGRNFFSEWSEINASTDPGTPKNIKATSITTKGYTIKWNAVPDANCYVVYRYDRTTKKFLRFGEVTTPSIKITGRDAGQRNTYKIKAVKRTSFGTYVGKTVKVGFATKPSQVKNLRIAGSGKNVKISWNKVTNATGYQIYYNSKKSNTSILLKEVTSGNTTSYTANNFPNDKDYYIKVRAVTKGSNVKTAGKCSSWVKKSLSANKSFNSIMSNYSNSNTIKTLNTQGYNISWSKKNRLQNALTSQGGSTGFLMYDLETGAVVAYNANGYFGTASTVKMPYMLYALKEMEDGYPTLDTKLTLQWSDIHGGAGVMQYSPVGSRFTIRQVIQHISDYSDNTAYFLLQRNFPYTGYNKYISSLGCQTSINSWQRWGYISAADSTREWIEMYDYLQNGKYKTFMKQELSTMVAGYFRTGLNNKYTVYSKSGWTSEYQHDTAVVMAEHPYILICLTNRNSTYKIQEVGRAAEDIHNEMWNYFKNK